MANNNSKVDKAQLFQKPSAVSGIRGTIRRRQEAFAQEQAKERQENIQKAEKYIQRIQKGEITNINDVPKGPRKYIDLGNFFEENKQKIKSKLEYAEKKEKQLRQRYEKGLKSLYDWYGNQEKTESVRRAFREERRDLKEGIRSEAEYYEELSSRLKDNLNKLEKGEILDAKSVIDFSERAADIEQRRIEGRVESERLEEFREEYTTKKNGEVSLKEGVKREDLPTQFKQFVDVKSVKRGGTKGFTQKERDKISAWMKKNKMTPTPETIRKDILSKPKVKVQEKISNKDAYEILGIEKPKIESEFVRKVFEERRKDVIESRQNLQQETERYKELGFPQNKAQVLAEESLRKGGVTFTPEGATDVLLEDIAKEQNKKIRQNLRSLGDTWENVLSKYGAAVPIRFRNIVQRVTGLKPDSEDVYKDTRELLQGVSGVMQSLRQKGVQKLSEKEINNLEKEISNLEESLKEGEKVYSTSWGMYEKADSKKLEEVRKELEETRKQVTSGIPTKSAQIKGAVIDIGADIFPPKAIADIADILGQVLPTDEQRKKAAEKIKEKGWEGIKDVSSRAWKNVKDFFTNREQKEQLETTIKEINEEKQKARDLIKEGKVENPAEVRDYINSLEEQEKNAKTLIDNLETNKFINIGIAAAALATTSAGLFRRLRGKKISTDATDYFTNKATAEEFVKKSNSQIDTVKVKDSPFVGMDIGFDEISYLNKNILKNKVDPKNVKDVQIRYSTDRLPGKAFVKKFREKISPGVKVDRYGVRYKPDSYINKIDVIMNLKDGTRKAFSVTSKAKIPFFRFKNLKNSLKYGTNKRVDFIKQAQAEDMLMGVRTRPRKVRGRDETRFTPEEYFLGRQIGKEKKKGAVKETISEVRRKPKVADKKRLSAEEYWKFGERVSVQKTRRVEKPVQRTYLGDFGVGPTFTRKVSFGKTKTINTDLGLDTSTLSYYLSRHIEQIKKLPKSKWDMNKLTRQDKANLINNIYNRNIKPADLSNPRYSSKLVLLDKAIDTAKAIDSGKGTVLLKNKNVKKLTDQDYLDIQSAISSQSIPKVKYESLKKQSSKIVDNTSKKVKNTRNKISNSLNKITKIRNQLGYGFVSPSKTKIDSSIKNLQEIRQELSKSLDELNKQSSEIKNVEKTINENIVGVTNESQLRDLQDTQSKISSLKTSITTQYQRITDITQNIRNIITEFRPDRIRTPRTPSLPKLPKSKKKIKKKRKQKDFIGYNTFMKPVGKKNWKKVNQFPMSYSNAQDLGAFKADNTLQASFRVRKGSAPARKPTEKFEKGYFLDNFDEFRNYKKKKGKKEFTPGQWIEKADRRLDSRSEVSSIQKARKKSSKKSKKNNKKKKKKKTKSAEDFWLS